MNPTFFRGPLFAAILISCFACSNKTMQENSAMADVGGVPPDKNIQVVEVPDQQRVNVLIDGMPFTSYIYPDNVKKPILYPLHTSSGTPVTRGFPLEPRAGERVDHPHHVGFWLNYGDVNGLDFWNNSEAIDPAKREKYGTIVHREVVQTNSGDDQGELEVVMDWMAPDGERLITEQTKFVFHAPDAHTRFIDRITKLTAQEEILFKDNKEGMIGIRVARELEHPSDDPAVFTDASGNPTDVPAMNNEGVTGVYHSSEGIEGEEVWGTRARWMNLTGTIGEEDVALIIMDHPDNVGHPTYWHARGYGLFAANPLGQEAMSGGKEQLNYTLPKGESVTFRHRLIIHSGEALSKDKIENIYTDFAENQGS